MNHPHTAAYVFTPTEKRITKEINAKLEELAPLFMIQVRHISGHTVELSGAGFSEGEPLVLSPTIAKIRLLAEISGILSRWISFNFWEPPEVTLLSLPENRIERCALNFRKQLSQQAKAAAKAAALAAALKEQSSR